MNSFQLGGSLRELREGLSQVLAARERSGHGESSEENAHVCEYFVNFSDVS